MRICILELLLILFWASIPLIDFPKGKSNWSLSPNSWQYPMANLSSLFSLTISYSCHPNGPNPSLLFSSSISLGQQPNNPTIFHGLYLPHGLARSGPSLPTKRTPLLVSLYVHNSGKEEMSTARYLRETALSNSHQSHRFPKLKPSYSAPPPSLPFP